MHHLKGPSRRRRLAPHGQLSNWTLAIVAGAIVVAVLATRALT